MAENEEHAKATPIKSEVIEHSFKKYEMQVSVGTYAELRHWIEQMTDYKRISPDGGLDLSSIEIRSDESAPVRTRITFFVNEVEYMSYVINSEVITYGEINAILKMDNPIINWNTPDGLFGILTKTENAPAISGISFFTT